MRQLLGLGVIVVGALAVYAAVTGNYKQALAALGLSINGGIADKMTGAGTNSTKTNSSTSQSNTQTL